MNCAMKNFVSCVNSIFNGRIGLAVMSVLAVNERIRFRNLEALLEVPGDPLTEALLSLEKNGFIRAYQRFAGRVACSAYSITRLGEEEFKDHVKVLEVMAIGIR